MSAHGGPDIVEDGLVLALDAANVKSFRGEPTVNLSYNNGRANSIYLASHTNWINSGTYTYNGNVTDVSKPDLPNTAYLPTDLRIQSGVTTSVGSQHVSCCYVPTILTPSTQYTLSVWFMQNRAGSNQPYLRTIVNNNSLGNFSYNGNTSASSWPVNEWIRITATATIQSNETGLYLSNYIGSQVGDKIWYYGHQLEQKSYATYLTTTPRGTTVATGGGWTDKSGNGNNGELVNGVGFNSDNLGSLVFDGVDDYVEASAQNIGLEFQPNQPYSVFCWIYNLTDGSGAIISNMDPASSQIPGWDLWRDSNSAPQTIAAHLISHWTVNAIKIRINFDYVANQNKWVNIGYTYNGSNPLNLTDSLNSVNFYINGQLETSGKQNAVSTTFNTTPAVITYTSSQRFRVASRWSSSGLISGSPLTISQVQIYNKSLTAQEVLQNYNATKGRYGL